MSTPRSIRIELGSQLIGRSPFPALVGSERLRRAGIFIGVGGLIIDRLACLGLCDARKRSVRPQPGSGAAIREIRGHGPRYRRRTRRLHGRPRQARREARIGARPAGRNETDTAPRGTTRNAPDRIRTGDLRLERPALARLQIGSQGQILALSTSEGPSKGPRYGKASRGLCRNWADTCALWNRRSGGGEPAFSVRRRGYRLKCRRRAATPLRHLN
jgi:hypothetical protein